MELIDKDALVAEIEKRIKKTEVHWRSPYGIVTATGQGVLMGYRDILSLLDILEVKEVELKKEFNNFLDSVEGVPKVWHSDEQIEWGKDIARHFFEFGMIASNKA